MSTPYSSYLNLLQLLVIGRKVILENDGMGGTGIPQLAAEIFLGLDGFLFVGVHALIEIFIPSPISETSNCIFSYCSTCSHKHW